jgi:hypothetical protein
MLALTSLTIGGRSVGLVRWRTEATELVIPLCVVFAISFNSRHRNNMQLRCTCISVDSVFYSRAMALGLI